MCGVPYHAAEGYIARLIQKGYRVAICEQMEDPRLGKKLVRREVTRIVTPGTATDIEPAPLAREQLSGRGVAKDERTSGVGARRYLDRRVPRHRDGTRRRLAGALETSERARSACHPARLSHVEPDATVCDDTARRAGSSRTTTPTARCAIISGCLSLDGCGLADRPLAVGAAGAILHYLRDTQRAALDHLDRPALLRPRRVMVLDAVTVRNLELVEPMFAADERSRHATLIHVLDQTCTGMGGRLLRQRLLRPSIESRGDRAAAGRAWANCCSRPFCAPSCARQLGGILDLERLLAKVTLGSAEPARLLALGRSLEKFPALQALFRDACRRRISRSLHEPRRAGGCRGPASWRRSPTSRR